MLETLAFVAAVACGLFLARVDVPWYWAAGIAIALWWLLGAILWRVRRRTAQRATAATVERVKARLGTDAVIADPTLDLFVAVDSARRSIVTGKIGDATAPVIPIDRITSAKVVIDTGWGLFLDRERTPAGRLLATLYYPLQPVMMVFALLSIFDAGGGGDPTINATRVRRIRIVAEREDTPLEIMVYDERRSATYAGAAALSERAAREVVAAIRRGITRSGRTLD